jgi:hypothetical protein
MGVLRWWNMMVGGLARILTRYPTSELPRRQYDCIEMVVLDEMLGARASQFFDRTAGALTDAASLAPKAYSDLCEDVRRIVLSDESFGSPYHRFQLAIMAPQEVALESAGTCYTAWLLYVSGLARGETEARARVSEFMEALDHVERSRVQDWLAGVFEGRPRDG